MAILCLATSIDDLRARLARIVVARTRDGRAVLAIGGAGGRKIPNSEFEILTRILALGKTLPEAMAAPRIHTEGDRALSFEKSWPAMETAALSELGYRVSTGGSASIGAAGAAGVAGAGVAPGRVDLLEDRGRRESLGGHRAEGLRGRQRADGRREAVAGEVAEQHSEQKRNPGRLQHRAGAVAMGDVPDFVTDDAGQFVGAFGLGHQSLEDVDVAAGKCNGVGLAAADNRGSQGNRQFRAALESRDQLVERVPAGLFRGVGRAAFEGLAVALAGVQHRPHLGVDGGSELLLDRHRDQRGDALHQRGKPEHRDQHERHACGQRPADDLPP